MVKRKFVLRVKLLVSKMAWKTAVYLAVQLVLQMVVNRVVYWDMKLVAISTAGK